MKMIPTKWYWYLICAALIVLGCILLFGGYDFAQVLRIELNHQPNSNIVEEYTNVAKGEALTLSFQITGGILLAGGLFAGLMQLKKDLKL